MEFFDVVRARHSIRAYDGRPVEPEKLQQILDMVRSAPSAGNLQAFEIYLVCDQPTKAALAKASGDQDFLMQAPINLVFCSRAALSKVKYEERGQDLYCLQDATIACAFAMLAATALGLSTVWVGAFDEHAVQEAVRVPKDQRPIAILPIGYGAEAPRFKVKRVTQELQALRGFKVKRVIQELQAFRGFRA
jgi:nitroreductase